ncbi:MAG: UDP-N-acetylglucosamine 2-epimerase (hydrolyzing) [Candidatus Omnitrophica bacterium CG11_big_fil_rev_8_21_14_0_20_45_26]|uniref:UDP-N-acetylglucosamine 2-epimerase (Hydrolyzing) n=1 Tax=Candidatus Abzuiibacterium crystallinum TaxID=1974748 RepID=A0A2H0LQX4_9BACT|nr:MAG: UDP-N-acetylglucosamine 2-epimerase (hydrolyzing) [Candidatus Omnitrophica bacterium CG11_big_fil_rev_8_21_14_0_20_45_26]PIW64673.1 MAG: UDP-N-acetylglucosamine 2-epimerase (hydrolyzing) [Candidatus Omnitrophica bacterium CG12_big_fil_rev_8_21_14_0_65_45_16]
MRKRRIAVITAARATYGYSKRLMKLIKKSKRSELQLVVTGMHLMKRFGYTINEIKRDGLKPAATVDMTVRHDTALEWTRSLGIEIQGMARVFDRLDPDVVLLSGDRAEMLGAAVAACYMNKIVAHIQSGDLSGHIDGSARHAITKLAHIHFPACQDSADRVIKMGEERWRVFNVGAPQLDEVVQGKKLSKEEIKRIFKCDFSKPVLLIIQHPVLYEMDKSARQMNETLAAARLSGYETIVIYPNVDAGGQKIIETIHRYAKHSNIKVYRNIDRPIFLSLLKYVKVLLGNSSASILEAPSFKLAAVNIGNRQIDRMCASNVIHVPNFRRHVILKAIKYVIGNQRYQKQLKQCRNPYGDGHSSERILKILECVNLERFKIKRMTY